MGLQVAVTEKGQDLFQSWAVVSYCLILRLAIDTWDQCTSSPSHVTASLDCAGLNSSERQDVSCAESSATALYRRECLDLKNRSRQYRINICLRPPRLWLHTGALLFYGFNCTDFPCPTITQALAFVVR